MKILKVTSLVLLMSLVAMANTEDLGNDVFSNEEELINLVADAAVAVRCCAQHGQSLSDDHVVHDCR